MLSRTMARHAIAATGRNARLQVRNGGMAEGAVAIMGDIDRLVVGPAGIVTARAGCAKDILDTANGHITGRNMGRMQHCLVGVTRQAVGRVGAQSEGVDHLLPRAVVTGGTGAGAVGGDVMLGAINLRPVRHDMADATRRTVRQISCAQCHSVTMRMAVEVVRRMTLRTVASGCCWSIGCCVMAAGTVVMFLDVRCVGKRSSNSDIMTTSTFSLQRDCGRMILAYMGGKVTCYSSMALAAIASR